MKIQIRENDIYYSINKMVTNKALKNNQTKGLLLTIACFYPYIVLPKNNKICNTYKRFDKDYKYLRKIDKVS